MRTETCPLFVEGMNAEIAARLCWHGFQPFGGGIAKGTIAGMPSLIVRTETCPLFAVDMSDIIASHVRTERASVVSCSSKRAPFISTITCVSEPREQNESSLFMASCSRTMTSEIGLPRRIR